MRHACGQYLIAALGLSVVVTITWLTANDRVFWVTGPSMEPTLAENDLIWVSPARAEYAHVGCVAVLKRPWPGVRFAVKRVVATFGHCDGLSRANPLQTTCRGLHRDEFLVSGDNRPVSVDSRQMGPVDRASFIGCARLVLLPSPRSIK